MAAWELASRAEHLRLVSEVRHRHDAAARLLDDALTEQRIEPGFTLWGARELLKRARPFLEMLAGDEHCA
jgi:hypothetical protein